MLNARNTEAMMIPHTASVAKIAYTVLFTLVCSIINRVLSFGGCLHQKTVKHKISNDNYHAALPSNPFEGFPKRQIQMLRSCAILPNLNFLPVLKLLQQNTRLAFVVVKPNRSSDAFKTRVPQRVQKKRFPQGIPVFEIVHRESVDGRTNVVGYVLYRQGYSPDAIVRVAMETRVLTASSRVIL